MTTYADREASVADSEPVELYEFSRVADAVTQYWRYANTEAHVVFGGETFSATPGLKRGPIEQSGEDVTMQVEVDIPRLVCLTDELHGTISPAPIRLRILRWQRGLAETEVASLFNGEISGAVFEESMVHITGTSEEAAWGDALVRTPQQRLCPHMLYDTLCGADKDAATATFKITAISDDRLTVTVDGSDPDFDPTWIAAGAHRYVGGVLDRFGYRRYIIGQSAADLMLQIPLMADLVVGDLVAVTAGCDRSTTDCNDIHGNLPRFGGFPLMPDRSPWSNIQ